MAHSISHLSFGSALLVALLAACAGSPGSSSSTEANEPTRDASARGAADAAPADGGTATSDVDAGQCGEMADADYLMHTESLDHLASCGVEPDKTGRFSIPFVEGPHCTIERDLDICVTTITCKEINGRFEMTSTFVWKLKGHGPLARIVEDMTYTTVDPMFGSTTSCRYEVTYTKL